MSLLLSSEERKTAAMKSYQYETIENSNSSNNSERSAVTAMACNDPVHQKKMRPAFMLLIVASVGMLTLMFGYANHQQQQEMGTSSVRTEKEQVNSFSNRIPLLGKSHTTSHHSSSSSSTLKLDMPHGVNFGSWLSLEDYFYVGDTGAVEVATPDPNFAAVCLPPLHLGQIGAPMWHSETDLLVNLFETTTVAHALKVFHAHRTSFITEHDLEQLHTLGIRHVRVPLSWCFTDHDPDTEITNDATDADLLEKFTCADPFYKDEGVLWPAVPRALVAQFLRSCAKYGITASLDLHTYPGATSPGTFSGVWPKPPRFWKYDNPATPAQDLGRQLYRDFIRWVEDLDQEALDGVLGISPMNEPAHLAGVFANIPSRDYLPPLPDNLAETYWNELNSQYIPKGPHLRVLLWLRDAVDVFRGSQLPKLGIQLQVNLHESVLIEDLVPGNNGDHGGRGNPASHRLIAAWWNKTTSKHERKHWAVLDIHHYHAWSPSCLGASDGPPSGNYSCGDIEGRHVALKRCTEWATDIFRPAVDEMCGKGAKLMSGEFSTSTHHRVRHACNDIDTLKESYMMQMEAAKEADVDLYYWSYKMPYGGAFRSAWSFSELMYLLGATDRPDHDNFDCGEHIPHIGEVTDDFFGN